MPKIEKAALRHATYYFNLYRSLAGHSTFDETDWQKFENDLPNLRRAWEWLRINKDTRFATKELFIAYAELGWVLLELSHKHLARIIWTKVVKDQAKAKNDQINDEIIQKLNSLLSSQEQILAALPINEIFGSRNAVISGDVINASIQTGNIFLNLSEVSDYRRLIESARQNNDLKLVGSLLFEKSKILHKLGYFSEAKENAEEALKNFTEIEDANSIKVEKQLLEWKETISD
jgi:tetratricopeptide (TPR) repeat protein